MPKTFNYGGQAVIEGVMIRGRESVSVAVRRPNGEVRTLCEPLASFYTGSCATCPSCAASSSSPKRSPSGSRR